MPEKWVRAITEMTLSGAGCYRLEEFDFPRKRFRRTLDVFSSKQAAEAAFHRGIGLFGRRVHWADWQLIAESERQTAVDCDAGA